jgi:hypothetical protein
VPIGDHITVMTPEVIASTLMPRVERLLRSQVASWRVVRGGYTPAIRLVCETSQGSFFIKAGSTTQTTAQLRIEMSFYERASGPFLPQYIASEDHPLHPLLIMEDLSMHHWPPPWDADLVDTALVGIDALHGLAVDVGTFAEIHGGGDGGWAAVARDPEPLISLGTVSADWLEHSLPALLAEEARCATQGDAFTHFDLRSDNMCFVSDRAVFIDWNCACRSNPKLDIGFWLPSLAAEGGPSPDAILPNAPEIAAWVSGFFAARAGLPVLPFAPRVREVQKVQLAEALPWAIRALDLSQPEPRL